MSKFLEPLHISCFRNSHDNAGSGVLSLSAVADHIRTGGDGLDELTRQCHTLAKGDRKAYRVFKKTRLPAVTFAGEFLTRKKGLPFDNRMKAHSGLVVLDFDGVDIGTVMAEVSQMPSTGLAFVSPSGAGVKVVVCVEPAPAVNVVEHKSAFRAAVKAYEHIAIIDDGGSDATRLCFLAHYPQVFFEIENRVPISWELDTSEAVEKPPRQYTGDADISALEFISSDDYDTWLRVGMACHAAGVPFGVWHEWSRRSENHEPCECTGTWNSFSLPSNRTEKSVTWASVVSIAREGGYKGKSMVENTTTTTKPAQPSESEPEISISNVKSKIKVYAVNENTMSETEKSNTRSEIFDAVSQLSPSDIESLISIITKSFELGVGAVRAEIKQRQRERKRTEKAEVGVVPLECANRADDGKPMIWITESDGFPKHHGQLAREVFDVLVAENESEPFIFDNGGWCEVRQGTERISDVGSDAFRAMLADRFYWWKVVNSKQKGICHFPVTEVPAHIAKAVETHRLRHVSIPRLERVVNRPLVNPDGNFETRRGYVSDLNTYILADFDIEKMSIKKARDVLVEPFKDFPFATDKDRACAFAYLFTLLLRERLGVHVPFFHFGAARQGTGKGLLCRTLFYITEGREIAHATYYKDEERLIRSTSSFLLGGAPGILYDNVSDGGMVANPFLEMIATAPVVSLRVLYQTLEREVPVNSVIAFTGNNLSFDSGLRRRVQHCYLDIEIERPELRNLPDLKRLVRTGRNSLLSAAFTIIHNWIGDGCPQENINLGSYEIWSNVIASVLDVAGIDGFQPVVREMSDRDVARRIFVKAVWDKFGTDNWGVKETLLIASNGTDETPGQGILAEFLTGDKRNHAARLGYVLRTFANQVFEFDDDRLSLRVERVEGVSPVQYFIKNLNSDDDMIGF